jgi:hypothetical protein
MEAIYIPILSALVGGLTAVAASLGTVWLQGSAQDRRERVKVAKDIAMADYKERMELM